MFTFYPGRSGVVSNLILVVAIFSIFGCRGGSSVDLSDNDVNQPGPNSGGMPTFNGIVADQTLDEAQQLINNTAVPDGVDAGVFKELQAALIDVLEARGEDKFVAAAPSGDENIVNDLYVFGDEFTGIRLEWTYLNNGDYNLDGEVGINDITPIAIFFQESVYGENWSEARHADGNGDGEVSVNDITPIGMWYNTYVAAYNIYGAVDLEAVQDLIGSLPNGDFPADSFFDITYEIPEEDEHYRHFWVVPVDSDGVEGVRSIVSRMTGDPAVVAVGTDTAVLSDTIDENGGEYSGPLGTALEGMTFNFKPGAVPAGTPLTLSESDGTIEPVTGVFGGRMVSFDTGEVNEFVEPVEITVPYPREKWSHMFVPYAVTEDGHLALLNLLEHDKEVGYMKFSTMHPTKFAWLEVLIESLPPGLWLTTYQPILDGFQVYNFGSNFSPGGQCAGMSFFSRWYWIHHAQDQGGLFNKYMYNVGSNYVGQNVLAIRAHTSLNRVYGQTKAMYLWYEDTATDEQNYLAICNSLQNSGRPVVIGLTKTVGSGGHAVLAYGFDDEKLWIYDSNHSDDTQYINYSAATKSFTPYGPFDNVYLAGDNTGVATYESFDNIWHDANYGFTNYGFAEVHVESHADGEIIAAGTTNITGYVASGQLLADTLNMYVDGVGHTRALQENGYFEFNGIPIHYGVNDIWFQVYGTSQNGQAFIPVESGYELDLVGSSAPPVFGVTLVWDKPNTDMDLYVTDPTGQTSWYSHLLTTDGGYLHGNVTDGFGPEYWELGQNDTIRYGSPYTIRGHYRDANGADYVVAHLGVRRYEGTGFEEYFLSPYWYTTSDHNNTDPAATGLDWKTLANVVLVNHGASSLDERGFKVEYGEDGIPTIYMAAH